MYPPLNESPIRSSVLYLPNQIGNGGFIGVGSAGQGLTPTPTSAVDSDGRWTKLTTAATTNSLARFIGSQGGNTRFDLFPKFFFRIKLDSSSLANTRLWIGLSSGDMASVTNPTSLKVAMFAYDSGIDANQNWYVVTSDGAGNVNRVDTGVALTLDGVYDLAFDSTQGTFDFYIGGAVNQSLSTNLPTGSTILFMFSELTTLAAAAVSQRICSAGYESL